MAADLSVFFDFGGTDANPGTQEDTDLLGPPHIRFKTADDATIDELNPVPIPAAGTKYSFMKQLYLKCAVAPSTKVDNIQLYTDGAGYGTGITLKVGEQFPTKTSVSNAGYEVATGTPGDTGDEMVGAHAGLTSSIDLFTKTVGSALAVTIGEASSQIDAIGETTNYVALQVEVLSTAVSGDKANETLSWQYDEV